MKKIIALVLMLSMLFSLLAVPMGTLAQENDNNFTISQLLETSSEDETTEPADNRVNFPIDEEHGANSRFFIEYYPNSDTDTKDNVYYTGIPADGTWVPGLDYQTAMAKSDDSKYYPTGDFAKDKANLYGTDRAGAFVYELDKDLDNSKRLSPLFETKEDGIVWTLEGVDYYVNPTDKAILLYSNVEFDNWESSDDELKADFEALNGVTLDVPDGNYTSIGFLVASPSKKLLLVTPIYADGSKGDELTSEAFTNNNDTSADNLPYVYTGNFLKGAESASKSSGRWTNTSTIYEPKTFTDIDPTKELVAVLVKNKNDVYPMTIVSAWGEKAGISYFISLIEEIMADGINNLDEYKSVKNYMSIIDADGGVMTDAQKAVYDNTLSALAAFEANLEEMEKEAERQEAMSKRTYNYLTLAADRDVFVTWKDITDLSRFQYDAAGTSSVVPDGFNTATYDCSGTTIFEWIPHNRADGTKVTGQEAFYFKGLRNISLPQLPENGVAPAAAPYAYLLEDITGDDDTSVAGKRIAGIGSGGDTAKYGADEYFLGTNGVARATSDVKKTVDNPEFLQKLDEDGYFIIKKEAGSETNYKIGPVSEDSYSPNAQIVNSSINNVNAKGTTLDVLITAGDINYSSTNFKKANSAVNVTPVSALQQVVITYEGGETDTKYIAVTKNTIATYDATYSENPVIKSIVFASKYDSQGNEIKYDGNSFYANKDQYDFKVLKGNLATVGLDETVSADAVKFKNPDIIMGSNTKVAQMINLRQDAMHNKYGAFSTSASLPLENKKIESISFPVNQSAALNASTAIPVIDGAKDVEKSTVALLPVEIEGASDDYVYFAYLARSTSDTYVMAATVTENSSNEKLEAANDAMSKITNASTIQEAKEALKLYNVAKEDKYLKDSDFNSALVESFMNTYTAIRENVKLTGKISVRYYNGEKPAADVEMYNYAELEGKTYKVIMAYYDENGICVGKDIFDKATTEAEKESYTVTGENCPETAVKVKGFIWKDFATLEPLAEANETEKKSTFKVLSIGNSYSGNAQKYLAQIAANAGFEKVVIVNLFVGGCTLNTHWANAEGNLPEYDLQRKEVVDGVIKTTTKVDVTMLEGIKSEDWDVITIQQGSTHSGKAETYGNLQKLIDYVNENKTNKNAKIVWHQTWAYRDNTDKLASIYPGMTQMGMYNAIMDATKEKVAPLEDIEYIIPVGTAIQNVRQVVGELVMPALDPDPEKQDHIHLSDFGCYVAGLTWFEKITGISVDTITYVPENDAIKDNLAAIKKAVKDALANPYAVTK